jgi:hypothetical protein
MTADTWPKKAETQYFALAGYAEMRQSVLAGMLQPYVAVSDLYGKLICEITLILGQSQPETTVLMTHQSPNVPLDTTLRDLMADIFDFLFEARARATSCCVPFGLLRRASTTAACCSADSRRPIVSRPAVSGMPARSATRHTVA